MGYAWYTVFLCMVAYIFSFIDRQVIALLIEPIREDLQISDTQFSLIHGLAFAIFYAIMGIPIARLADSKSRPMIIAIGIFAWSIATAICGASKNFWQLFAARMGVGVGEAALSPAAYSIISDSFPKSRLGFALGVYSIGSFIGSGLAFLIGGTVIEWMNSIGVLELSIVGTVKPWQMTFFIVGLPGIFIAALFYFTIRDPGRKKTINDRCAGGNQTTHAFSIREVLGYISLHRFTFIAHYIGFACLALSLYALLSWSPAFFMRKFDLPVREVGIYLGIMVLICNTAGVLTSGWLADYLARRGFEDAAMRAGMFGALGLILPAAVFSSMPGLPGTLLVLSLAMYFASFPMATSAAALQLMAPNQMRAQVTALFFLAMNILGITGGATLVALCTDYLFKNEQAVGYSISIVCSLAAVAGSMLLGWGLKHYSLTQKAAVSV